MKTVVVILSVVLGGCATAGDYIGRVGGIIASPEAVAGATAGAIAGGLANGRRGAGIGAAAGYSVGVTSGVYRQQQAAYVAAQNIPRTNCTAQRYVDQYGRVYVTETCNAQEVRAGYRNW